MTPSPTTVSNSSRSFIVESWMGPLKVMRLLPFSIRMRRAQPRSRSALSALSSSASSCRRRPSSGWLPAATTASRAASAESKLSLTSRSTVVAVPISG